MDRPMRAHRSESDGSEAGECGETEAFAVRLHEVMGDGGTGLSIKQQVLSESSWHVETK